MAVHLRLFIVLFFLITAPVLSKPVDSKVPEIVVSDSLKERKGEFLQTYKKAMKRLRKFAGRYGYESLAEKPFIDRIEIYDTKSGYDSKLKKLFPEACKKPIPKTFVAGIENRVFFSVSPEVYEKVYSEGKSKDAFEKLITHELAHRLHVRIVGGDEEKMGPIWFWEGFATYAAGQFSEDDRPVSDAEIKSILAKKERGSYRKYNKVFKHFLKSRNMNEYVKRASDKDFLAWLGVDIDQKSP